MQAKIQHNIKLSPHQKRSFEKFAEDAKLNKGEAYEYLMRMYLKSVNKDFIDSFVKKSNKNVPREWSQLNLSICPEIKKKVCKHAETRELNQRTLLEIALNLFQFTQDQLNRKA